VTTPAAASGSGTFPSNTSVPVFLDPNSSASEEDFAWYLTDVQQAISTKPAHPTNGTSPTAGKFATEQPIKEKDASEKAASDDVAPRDPTIPSPIAAAFSSPQQSAPPLALQFSLEKDVRKGSGHNSAEQNSYVTDFSVTSPTDTPGPLTDVIAALGFVPSNGGSPQSGQTGPAAAQTSPTPPEFSLAQITKESSTNLPLAAGAPPNRSGVTTPTPQEMAVAFRVKEAGQDSSSVQRAASVVKAALPVKEPRRVDLEEVFSAPAPRVTTLSAAAFAQSESSPSTSSLAPATRIVVPSEGSETAPVRAELPVKPIGPVRDLSIQIGQTSQEKVELRVTQQAGELRVAVRASDPELANGLRQSLPEVLTRLEETGYRAEAWRPAVIVDGTSAAPEIRRSSAESPQTDTQSQPGWSQQEHGQGQQESQRPKWVEELEGSLSGAGRPSTGAFHGLIY